MLLVLCDAFTPPLFNTRVMNLCRLIDRERWQPVIFSEQMPGVEFSTDVCPLYQMPYYSGGGKVKWAWLSCLNYLLQYKDIRLQRYIERNIDLNGVEIILCSSFNLFPLTTARRLSKKYGIPLVTDLRDIAEQWGDNIYFSTRSAHRHTIVNRVFSLLESINIRRRNRVIRHANAVVTVSPWHRDFLSVINPRTHLIYNGYDATAFTPAGVRDQTFRIVYTGRLYSIEFRRPHLLLQAIHELDAEGLISPDTVSIDWYIGGDGQSDLDALIRHYDVTQYCRYHQYVPADEIPALLNRASIVLQLASRASDSGPHGMMTTKFFEALGVEKPLLCVESDEECLAQTIRETNAGLSASDIDSVKRFIMEKYAEWQSVGYTRQPVNQDSKPYFSRQYQAKQFEKIFQSLTKTHNA